VITNSVHWARHYTPGLVTVHNFLNKSDISSLIYDLENNYLLKPAPIASGATDETDIRSSEHFFIQFDVHHEFHWLFEKLNEKIEEINSEFFQLNLYGYKEIQYTKYSSTQNHHYEWHMDMILGNLLNEDHTTIMSLGTRKLSVVVLLSEPEVEFQGGFLEFNIQSESLALTASMNSGTAVFFPSYLLHRVTRVVKGTRRSLVIWATGPKLK
jgi:PKHD-type hydroxylase